MADAQSSAAKTHQKYFDDQFDDEEVLYVFRKHPVVMRKGLILWALGMLVGPLYVLVLSFVYRDNPAKYPTGATFFLSLGVSLLLAFLLFAPSWISWYFSVFIITDQRFIQIHQKGLWHRGVSDISLAQIQSINYEVSGLQETVLGFGTIKMQTYVGDVMIHDVHHPAKIQKKILTILRDEGVTATIYPMHNQMPIGDQESDNEEA